MLARTRVRPVCSSRLRSAYRMPSTLAHSAARSSTTSAAPACMVSATIAYTLAHEVGGHLRCGDPWEARLHERDLVGGNHFRPRKLSLVARRLHNPVAYRGNVACERIGIVCIADAL